jgi:hypothetical protein
MISWIIKDRRIFAPALLALLVFGSAIAIFESRSPAAGSDDNCAASFDQHDCDKDDQPCAGCKTAVGTTTMNTTLPSCEASHVLQYGGYPDFDCPTGSKTTYACVTQPAVYCYQSINCSNGPPALNMKCQAKSCANTGKSSVGYVCASCSYGSPRTQYQTVASTKCNGGPVIEHGK